MGFLGVVYLVYLGLIGVQTVKIFVLTYADRVFENLGRKIQIFQMFKSFRHLSAIEPIRKDGNEGKFRKPHFSGI